MATIYKTPNPYNKSSGMGFASPLSPPPPAVRESSGGGGHDPYNRYRPPRGPVQIIPPGGAPVRGPVVPQIPRKNRQLAPTPRYTDWKPWNHPSRLPRPWGRMGRVATRMHPIGRAVDIGFQFMDGWSKYGPQEADIPAGFQFPAGWEQHFYTPWEPDPEWGYGTNNVDFHVHENCREFFTSWGDQWNFTEITANSRQSLIGPLTGWQGYNRWVREVWARPGTDPADPTVDYPYRVPYNAEPIPGRQTVQQSPTTDVAPLPVIRESANGPRQSRNPYSPPYEVPAETVEVSPGGGSYRPNDRHVLAPPAPGQKELKIKVEGGTDPRKLASWLWDRVTHYDDLIDIIADSIEGNPCRAGTPQAKVVCIGENLHKVDPQKLLYNYAWNELEDRLVGKALSYSKNLPFGGMAPGRMGDRPRLNIRQLPK